MLEHERVDEEGQSQVALCVAHLVVQSVSKFVARSPVFLARCVATCMSHTEPLANHQIQAVSTVATREYHEKQFLSSGTFRWMMTISNFYPE